MSSKAIFLDRDGVLINNKDHYYVWKKDQMELVEGVLDNLKKLSLEGYKLFIVTNQGGISRGIYTKLDIENLHADLILTFRKNNIEITGIAFCPHHSDIEKCLCRKPASLMIDKLIAKYQISKSDSYFIGDSDSDIESAQKAGIRGIKIDANKNMFPFISFLIR
jgi:D-glycero-D-manno-heptose 1,7-bisphosphate phosphatase